MSAQTIYNTLVRAGMTRTGAVAMLCNMYAESGLKADAAQRGQTWLTDEEYTAAADGRMIEFVHDGVGYGLCQWTFHTRKQELLKFCRDWGISVGSEEWQTDFCVAELKRDYPDLWDYLCHTDELYTAVSRICKEYERPAVNNVDARYSYRTMFEGLSGDAPDVTKLYPADMAVLCRGFYGQQVALLQKLLHVAESGVYDRATEAAVIGFQKENGLTADGLAGRQTWERLKERIK